MTKFERFLIIVEIYYLRFLILIRRILFTLLCIPNFIIYSIRFHKRQNKCTWSVKYPSNYVISKWEKETFGGKLLKLMIPRR